MKYPTKAAHGHAGEFFAAYKIAKVLGWPCRLFDIDIGIDAQVEILTDDFESTGRFVALQVKATSDEEKNCCYVTPRQLEYWCSLEIPVFVALVDLQEEKMFLHLVEATQEYEKTPKGKCKISFNLQADLFSPASAAILTEASERLTMSHIHVYLQPVEEAIKSILQSVQNVRDGWPDRYALIDEMEGRNELFGKLDQADAASAISRVGEIVITKCRNELSWALFDLQIEMDGMTLDYGEKADIKGFLQESYLSRPDTD